MYNGIKMEYKCNRATIDTVTSFVSFLTGVMVGMYIYIYTLRFAYKQIPIEDPQTSLFHWFMNRGVTPLNKEQVPYMGRFENPAFN